MSDSNSRSDNRLISTFTTPSEMNHIAYQKSMNETKTLIDHISQNNYCDQQILKQIEKHMTKSIHDLYRSLNTPDFIDESNDEIICNIQNTMENYIPKEAIKPAYISYMIQNILGVFESDKIDYKRSAAFAQKVLVELLPIINGIQTDKNIDAEKITEQVGNCFDKGDIFIPNNAKIEKLGYTINGIENGYENFNKDIKMYKFEKGECQARLIGSNVVCPNKTENGKICCSQHQPLSQQEKKFLVENKTTISSNSSETTQSECSNNGCHDHDHEKCKYICDNNKQCKNIATVGGFCPKCHKKHTEISTIHKSNDYCTIIINKGINKGRVCGKESCGKGIHICVTHASPKEKRKCPHINKNGEVCNNNINNPLHNKCGVHINCISYEQPEERKKSEAELEWEEKQREKENQKVKYCEMSYKNGNPCKQKGPCHIKEIDKSACARHYDLYYEEKEEEKDLGKTHRCLAICYSTGKQCRAMNVYEGFSYCNTHNTYDPDERCGGFDNKTLNRCAKKCIDGLDFCVSHKKCTYPPIKEDHEVEAFREQIRIQESLKKIPSPKLKIISDEEFIEIQSKLKLAKEASVKTPIKLKIINEEAYGLDCYVSNSEENSDCTEKSELEIIEPVSSVQQVKPRNSIVPDELELINKATGWVEDQILKMKSKRILKRIVGPRKQFNLEKTIFESTKALENYYTKVIKETNAKYKGCKIQFENLIRATYQDLSDSVENVIGLFGIQRFFAREKILDNFKEALKILRTIKSQYENKIQGLPIPNVEKKLVNMDIEKYVVAFEDVKNTFNKERKEDIKYVKEFEQFINGPPPKNPKSNYQDERDEKRKQLNEKYKNYFEKYIVRFAKVALHKENSKGRMFGFANHFIDILKEKKLDYTLFRNAYGGEIRKEDGEKYFYCDVFSIITNIINKNLKDDKVMNYLDVDISMNLSASEHQTEFSEGLRECKRTGKTKYTAKSMLDEGVVEKFNARDGFYDYEWKQNKESINDFCGMIPCYFGNALEVIARKNNYPNYAPSRDIELPAPVEPRCLVVYGSIFKEQLPYEQKPSFENTAREILGMEI